MESPINAAGAARATEDTSAVSDVRAYRQGDTLKKSSLEAHCPAETDHGKKL